MSTIYHKDIADISDTIAYHDNDILTTQVGPEMNSFCQNCNGVEMAGDTYSLKTTLCWV